MKVNNTTIFMGDQTLKTRKQAGTGNAADNQKRSSIFGGNMNQTQDVITQKKQEAQKKIKKIIGDTQSGLEKVSNDLKDRYSRIQDLRKEVGKSQDSIDEIETARKDLRDSMGLTEESLEEQDLKLLEKRAQSGKSGLGNFTEEENKRLAEIDANGLTEYQQRSMEMYYTEDSFKKAIDNTTMQIQGEVRAISSTKLELLKKSPMVEAKKTANMIQAAADDQIMGMLMGEGMEHINEKMEEEIEAAEEKAEEKEENEELTEKLEEKEQQQEELQQQIEETISKMVDIENNDTDIQREVKELLDKLKLMEEDLKGAAVDTVV